MLRKQSLKKKAAILKVKMKLKLKQNRTRTMVHTFSEFVKNRQVCLHSQGGGCNPSTVISDTQGKRCLNFFFFSVGWYGQVLPFRVGVRVVVVRVRVVVVRVRVVVVRVRVRVVVAVNKNCIAYYKIGWG